MQNTISLSKNSDFKRLYSRGRFFVNDLLVIYYRKNNLSIKRLGIVANKKVGKAVVRNKVKRLIKESYRCYEKDIKNGYDIIFVSRVKAGKTNYISINKATLALLKRTEMMK